ncbi:glycosyltransferase [Methanoculleus sp.]|uniref:glycosyltransferase n=1 Tax=Methanoculleus sp. TaxID=90427 RepID=UPI0026344087|nr:glycosyltransferase [Methanoculleus sp.]MDI6867739.1 glycosyltransferase [Methanoculleus sp.]
MRVAFVTFEYPPFIIGGAGVYAARVTEELASLGHQVVVFTPAIDNTDGVEHSSDVNLQVWHVPVREAIPFKALQFWMNLPGAIKGAEKEQEFDIIHINGLSYWFLPRRLSMAPHLLTVHHLVRDAAENTKMSFFSRIRDISGENGYIISLIEKRALTFVNNFNNKNKCIDEKNFQLYHLFPDPETVDTIEASLLKNKQIISARSIKIRRMMIYSQLYKNWDRVVNS